MDRQSKRILFFKGRIMEQLEGIRDYIGDARYKLYVAIVEQCNDYEELRDMAELELQLDTVAYTRDLIRQLEENNIDIKEVRNREDTSLTDCLDEIVVNMASDIDNFDDYIHEEDHSDGDEDDINLDGYYDNDDEEENEHIDEDEEDIEDLDEYFNEDDSEEEEDIFDEDELDGYFDEEVTDEDEYTEEEVFEDGDLDGYFDEDDSEEEEDTLDEDEVFDEDELGAYYEEDSDEADSELAEDEVFEDDEDGFGDYFNEDDSDEKDGELGDSDVFEDDDNLEDDLLGYIDDEEADESYNSDNFEEEEDLDDLADYLGEDEEEEPDNYKEEIKKPKVANGTVNRDKSKQTGKNVGNVFMNGTERGSKVQKTFNILHKIAGRAEVVANKTAKDTHKKVKSKLSNISKSDLFNLESNSNEEYIDF